MTIATRRWSRCSPRCVKRSCLFESGLQRRAKDLGKALHNSFELAFRRRYNLPPTDERFLSATREEIIADYWANHYAENGLKEEYEDDDFQIVDDDDWEDITHG